MDRELLLTLTRIEGTLALIDEKINGLTRTDHDHEARIRILEQRPAITPRAVWLAAGTVAAIAAASAPFLGRLYS